LTEQLGEMFGESAKTMTTTTNSAAMEKPVRKYLQSQSSLPDPEAVAALQKLQIDTQSLFVELLTPELRQILRVGKQGIGVSLNRKIVLRDISVGPDSCRVGKIYQVGDSMYYPIVAAIADKKLTTGYLIRWRSVFATATAVKQFSGLLGTDAALYVGNQDGSGWTDLAKPVDAPPADTASWINFHSYSRQHSTTVIALMRPISNTSWVVLLEFSREKILEGAKRFLNWMLFIGGVITIAGIAVAWTMSRNITTPLKKLTAAASALAAGGYIDPIEVKNSSDELGALAKAFNTMVVKINNSKLELEEKVKARTLQLERVNKESEAFSYSVSHDLRAPLRAVSGYANILKEDYAAKLDAEAIRITDTIIANAKMMGQLIDDLIDLAKADAAGMLKQPVNMKELATSCKDELLSQETVHHYRFNIENIPECNGDVNLLRQVWVNLISNAIKYSSGTAEPIISIGGLEKDTSWEYFIRDNGAGFDMRYADKLFGVFQRLHTTEKFAGTGIGLALVKRILAKHNGSIRAEAEPGKGAVFYFSIPK
ncbi:MAG: ATP-binding protein, partial [Bacteroidota bacterium]